MIQTSLERNDYLFRDVESLHKERTKHFRQRFQERLKQTLSIYDCLIIEDRLFRGEGFYVRLDKNTEGEDREARVLKIKKKWVLVIYNRNRHSLITAFRPSRSVQNSIAKRARRGQGITVVCNINEYEIK